MDGNRCEVRECGNAISVVKSLTIDSGRRLYLYSMYNTVTSTLVNGWMRYEGVNVND